MRRGPGRHPGAGVVFGDAQQVTERVTLLQHVLRDLVTGPMGRSGGDVLAIGRSGRDVLVGHVAKERRNGVRVVRRVQVLEQHCGDLRRAGPAAVHPLVVALAIHRYALSVRPGLTTRVVAVATPSTTTARDAG